MPIGATQSQTALKEFFGYESFRPLQEEVITHILEGKDALVLMPTGGGKSICYQLPAVLFKGITIVLSPLISLMKDQVDALKTNGIPAAFLNSTLDALEEEAIITDCIAEKIKLLYVAPERFLNMFQFFIGSLNISLFAIDEAHCISTWGHDFRPEYSQLKIIKQYCPHIPVVALTATADKVTRKDILTQLQLENPETFVSSFHRPNLSLKVRPAVSEREKKREILRIIQGRPLDCGIIYCMSRKGAEEMAAFLQSSGIVAQYYHAGMTGTERAEVQADFMQEKTQVICATIAFGMGIDKSNVRWVIHINLPKNIESYYQEIGRAGRDGLPSDTILYFNYRDIQVLTKFALESGQPDLQIEKLQRMQQYAEANICRRKILVNYFSEACMEECGNCDVCASPPQYFDGSVLIQKAASALIRMKEQVGLNMLIDVLRGSHKQEILELGYDKIKTYGVGADISAYHWKQYLMQMLNLGAIEMAYDDDFHLKVTDLGKEVLKGVQKMNLVQPQAYFDAPSKPNPKKTQSVSVSENLFDLLRLERRRLAEQHNLPPYVIFSDKTLTEMVENLPLTDDEFLEINGVNQHKLLRYGKNFMDILARFSATTRQ